MNGFIGSVLGSCRRYNEIQEYVNRTHTESFETMITHNKSFLRDKVESYFKKFVEIDQDDFSHLSYMSMIAYRMDNK